MPKGPKPIPNELKRLRGNPGRRRLADFDTPAFESVMPDPPTYLKGKALEEFYRLARILFDLNILTKLDVSLLGTFAWVNNELAVNSEELEKEQRFQKSKRGAPTLNPRVRYIRDLMKQQESLSDRFGASPTTRTRLKMVPMHKSNSTEPKQVLAERLFGVPVTKK